MAFRSLILLAMAALVEGTLPPVYRTQFPQPPPAPPRVYAPVPICAVTANPKTGSHIAADDCDSLADTAQLFTMVPGQHLIALTSTPSLCLTVGKDPDPDSGSPAIELQPCAAGSAPQVFVYNATSKQLVHNASKWCVDHDQTDGRVELYGCNEPVSSNQQWLLPAGTGHITPAGSNDTCMSACTSVAPGSLGAMTHIYSKGNTVNITAGDAVVRVIFYRDDIVRLWLAPEGSFSDPTHGELVLGTDFTMPTVTLTELADWIDIASPALHLRAYKDPLHFALFDNNGILLWKEAAPITWNTSSMFQTMQVQPDEYFYGGGMQCGFFSHKDTAILIEQGGGWGAGGRPNPAPFYMSTMGYGVLRNTYAIGVYSFLEPALLRHDEFRFDAFYFYGPSLKGVLEGYTAVSGRPFMPPIWGLQLGDSDCYNAHGRNTSDVVAIADNYTAFNLPAGWFIPNDGYGCGYTELDEVGQALRSRGYQLALWTSTGLGNATWEIGQAGSRGIKTDVGWVGYGYRFALNAVKLATSLLETFGNSRRYIWTVCGWASTQAFAVMWNGDNSGSWEYIRFQIPTVIGSGLSAQAHTSGDVDGIFGGSPDTYVRDLQWKVFLTAAMTMSGWAAVAKQPWRYGEPYTSYNRDSLRLKMRLTPYLYTYTRVANLTGVPPARGMVLEFPKDPVTWNTTTQYQFMCGEWLLVAPVYENTTFRDGIYLPAGDWFDYSSGDLLKGPTTLSQYSAPLWKIPVFVRAGAIIPMWPVMQHVFDRVSDPLTLDVYPGTTLQNTSFTLYEDDGITRNFNNEHAVQTFELAVSADGIILSSTPSVGTFVGKLLRRNYELIVHVYKAPTTVAVNGQYVPQVHSKHDFDSSTFAWYFDTSKHACWVKTGTLPTSTSFAVGLQ